MKYDFLSHSAILWNVSITITVNWANEVCHLEISKPSAIKRFFHEPQIKYSLGTLIFLKFLLFQFIPWKYERLSDAQNRNKNPVLICEMFNSTLNLKRSFSPNNMIY